MHVLDISITMLFDEFEISQTLKNVDSLLQIFFGTKTDSWKKTFYF